MLSTCAWCLRRTAVITIGTTIPCTTTDKLESWLSPSTLPHLGVLCHRSLQTHEDKGRRHVFSGQHTTLRGHMVTAMCKQYSESSWMPQTTQADARYKAPITLSLHRHGAEAVLRGALHGLAAYPECSAWAPMQQKASPIPFPGAKASWAVPRYGAYIVELARVHLTPHPSQGVS